MQNHWNLYLACRQQQLYGPVNYRDFWETVPCPGRLRDGRLSKCRPRGCSPNYSLPEGAWLRFFQCAVLFVPNFHRVPKLYHVCHIYIIFSQMSNKAHSCFGNTSPSKKIWQCTTLSLPKNWLCRPHFSLPLIIKDVLRRKLWVLIVHRMKEI